MFPISVWYLQGLIVRNFKMAMDQDRAKISAKQFRDYAAECRRMARNVWENDRAVLMQIADAWITCAEEAERAPKRNRN